MKGNFALAVVLLGAPVALLAAEQPEVLVEVTTLRGQPVKQICEGQSVLYTVTLNHVEKPSPPKLEGFDDFEITSLGERSLDSTQVTIINGQMTQVVRRGREYRYRLTPRKRGDLRIPSPVVAVDGTVLKGPEQTLRVRPADQQDVALVAIAVDRQSVYPMQPFEVTLSVVVKELPEPYADRSPVSVQRELRRGPPALRVPWLDDENLPDGLEPSADLSTWASPLLDRRGAGFSINGLATRGSSLFSLFDDPEPVTFLPEARKVTRKDKDGNDATYWQYDFVREFTPRQVGRLALGPVTLEGVFVTTADEEGRVSAEEIYAMAKPAEVLVKEVPEAGRPDTYVGAVGRFKLSASLAPTQAKVGDPMTLTLTLRGRGTLENAVAPDLARLPEIAGRFRIYEATQETKADSCRFTYGLRPLSAEVKSFPAVPVSYFDVETERYVTLRTAPVPMDVAQAERLSDDQIVATPGGPARKHELETRREGIFANVTDAQAVRDESVHASRWLLAMAGLAGLYVAVAVVTVQVQRLSADKALLRRRGAVAKARGRLQRALAALSAGRVRQGADLLQGSLVGLVADVADLPEAGLTPKDVSAQLQSLGAEDELVSRAGKLLETCDAARYGVSGQMDELEQQAAVVLDDLIRSLKAKKRFR